MLRLKEIDGALLALRDNGTYRQLYNSRGALCVAHTRLGHPQEPPALPASAAPNYARTDAARAFDAIREEDLGIVAWAIGVPIAIAG